MRTIKKIKFDGSEKAKIRDYVLQHVGEGENFLELYGNGECYKLAKSMGINVLSIDDGRDFNNKKQLEKIMKGKQTVHISSPMCLNVAVAGSIIMYDRLNK